MTIIHPKRFQQARPAGFDGVFDWDFLLPAFEGTKIKPMDLDAIVERYGKFLVLETKAPDIPIPRGQEITLNALVGLGCFTIFHVEGKTAEEIRALTEWHWNIKQNHVFKVPRKNADAEFVVKRARRWFEWASGWLKEGENTKETKSA